MNTGGLWGGKGRGNQYNYIFILIVILNRQKKIQIGFYWKFNTASSLSVI